MPATVLYLHCLDFPKGSVKYYKDPMFRMRHLKVRGSRSPKVIVSLGRQNFSADLMNNRVRALNTKLH
jgi:hypothetical protein